jgi:hypothetical protein
VAKNKRRVAPIKVPPKFSKGQYTPEERAANKRRSQWEYRMSLKAKGLVNRSFWFPPDKFEEIKDFIDEIVDAYKTEKGLHEPKWPENGKPWKLGD